MVVLQRIIYKFMIVIHGILSLNEIYGDKLWVIIHLIIHFI